MAQELKIRLVRSAVCSVKGQQTADRRGISVGQMFGTAKED